MSSLHQGLSRQVEANSGLQKGGQVQDQSNDLTTSPSADRERREQSVGRVFERNSVLDFEPK